MKRIPLSSYPELVKDFKPHLNDGIHLDSIGKTDLRYLVWECHKCGHHWEAKVRNRVKGQQPCPPCSEIIPDEESLARKCPEVAEVWAPTLNKKLSPKEVRANDFVTLYDWTCGKPGHIYKSTIGDKVRSFTRFGSLACSVCLNRVLVQEVNDLASQRPELAREWHDTKNAPRANEVTLGDTRKVWWTCPLGHDFQMKIQKRGQYGQGCNVCAGRVILEGFNDFASHRPLESAEWNHELNDKAPNQVALWSNEIAHWVCSKGHSWEAKISKRAAGHGCHTCKNRRVEPGFNDLATRFPLLAKEFDSNKNGVSPKYVLANDSTNRYWWLCAEGHQWRQLPMIRQNRGCGDCAPVGFRPNRPAKLYFIENQELRARKIGITNIEAREKRLTKFSANGWDIIFTLDYIVGHNILALEKSVLRWIRNDLGLPQFLGPEDLSQTAGWTETFSIEEASNSQVVAKIKDLWRQSLEEDSVPIPTNASRTKVVF